MEAGGATSAGGFSKEAAQACAEAGSWMHMVRFALTSAEITLAALPALTDPDSLRARYLTEAAAAEHCGIYTPQ